MKSCFEFCRLTKEIYHIIPMWQFTTKNVNLLNLNISKNIPLLTVWSSPAIFNKQIKNTVIFLMSINAVTYR